MISFVTKNLLQKDYKSIQKASRNKNFICASFIYRFQLISVEKLYE